MTPSDGLTPDAITPDDPLAPEAADESDESDAADAADDGGTRRHDENELGRSFWIGLAIGGAVMVFALRGILGDQAGTNPPGLLRYTFGAAVLHDAILAPVVAVVALLLAWILPSRVRGPIVAALALSGILALYAYPLVGAFGRHELNTSTLPLDYGRNLVIVIAFVWLGAATVIAIRLLRDHRST